MAEHYRFFDSADPLNPDRTYNAEEFTDYFLALVTTGVMKGIWDELEVTANGSDMSSVIGTGIAFVEGKYYKNDSPLVLTHDTEVLGMNRIDRVILRRDLSTESRYVRAFIKKGTPSTSPSAPSLTQNETIYEISLAEVYVEGGQTYLDANSITDERGKSYGSPWAGSNILPNFNDASLAELIQSVTELENTAVVSDPRTEIWVDGTNGNDTWEGTKESPYKTLDKAFEEIKKVHLGLKTIFVHPGTYSAPNLDLLSGHIGGKIELNPRDRGTDSPGRITIQGNFVVGENRSDFRILRTDVKPSIYQPGVTFRGTIGNIVLNDVEVSEMFNPTTGAYFDGLVFEGLCKVELNYCRISNSRRAINAKYGAMVVDSNTEGSNNEKCFVSEAAVIFSPSFLLEGTVREEKLSGGQIFVREGL